MLSACGGGGSSDPTSVAASAVDPASIVDIDKHPASVSGTAVPPAISISDASGAVWTVADGVVYRATHKAGATENVTLLLWYAGRIYQENSNNLWWVWKDNAWVVSTDPRPAVVTPPVATSATPVTPAASTSTAAAGSTAAPASTAASTSATAVASTSASSPATTSSAVTSTTASAIPFFGINEHYNYGGIYTSVPLNTQAATLADLGMTGDRQDIHDVDQIDAVADAAMPGLGSKVTVIPMIDAYPYDDPSLHGAEPTEASAYAYAYTMAAYAATRLKGVPVVEFGNEYDLNDGPIASDGENVSDYNNASWPIWRGALRGSEDGWRSVDTGHVTKIIANATSGWLHFGFLDGLMTGTQPDGTTGHPKITPDIIQWHWYSDGGDFENAVGASGTYNVLARLKASYNLPIMFTEIGVNEDLTSAQAQAYIAKTIPELVAAKATYNVVGFNWYELYDDPTGKFGLLTSSAAEKPIYTSMKSAIAGSQ